MRACACVGGEVQGAGGGERERETMIVCVSVA